VTWFAVVLLRQNIHKWTSSRKPTFRLTALSLVNPCSSLPVCVLSRVGMLGVEWEYSDDLPVDNVYGSPGIGDSFAIYLERSRRKE
jgi:hypothetical protein